jgi:hypothetical protein
MRSDRTALFCEFDWHAIEQNQKQRMTAEIDGIEGNRLLNSSVDDLCTYFVETYRVDVPVLQEDQLAAAQREVQIDISQDPMRAIMDRSRPYYIAGTAIDVTIPFTGDAQAFRIQPTSFTLNPPRGSVADGALTLTMQGAKLDPQQVRSAIDRELASIKTYLNSLQQNALALNAQLPQIARGRIEQRRQKLLGDQSLVAALGFALKERADAPRTYTTPKVRRRITPSLPPASSAPYTPEPVISLEDYEHILSVMTNMALVMERSPSAFSTMDEETLRSHFLVQLNGQYEGQATGETFNYNGKTDILIRVDGRNVFIAECKYWSGPKNLGETIDQLLGYASWRDTKVAIVIFNRQKNFSRVLEAISATVPIHRNFKHALGQQSESSFRYVFSHRDDPNREMLLTVMAFDVPNPAP